MTSSICNNSYMPSSQDINGAAKKTASAPLFGVTATSEDAASFSTATPIAPPATQGGLIKSLLAGSAVTALVIAVTHKNATGENLISRLTGKTAEKTPPLPHTPESANHFPKDLEMPSSEDNLLPRGQRVPPSQPKPAGKIRRIAHWLWDPSISYDDAVQKVRMNYERAEHQFIEIQLDLDKLQKAVDKAETRLAKAKARYAEKGRSAAINDIKAAIDTLESAQNDLRAFQKANAKQIAEIKKQRKARVFKLTPYVEDNLYGGL